MSSPIGGLLAGLGQGAIQGLQYRDRQRLLEQARQDRLAREAEERRRWETQQAYQRERDGVADERWKVGNDRQNRMDTVSLLDMGYEDAGAIAAPTEREQAAPSALDGLIQGIADQRVAGAIDVGGRTLVAPGENARQRQDRQRLEQSQDADRRQEAGFAQQLAMLAKQQAFQAEQNRLNNQRMLEIAGMRGQGQGRPANLRAPTEAQEKSYIYYGLMSTSTKRMQELGFVQDPQTGNLVPNPKIRPLAIKAALGLWGGNAVLNEDEQEYMKAARDFAAGVLRKESGAAIKDDELRDVFARYIDAPFDIDNTRKVKAASRDQYMGLMQKAAMPAIRYYQSVEDDGLPEETRPDPTTTGLPFGSY